MPSSKLFVNGPIYPITSPRIEGGALLVRGDRIAYLGPRAAVEEARGAEVIDLGGRPLFPGFCDAHLHLVAAAEQAALLDCRGIERIEGLSGRVAQRARNAPEGGWICGAGWEKRLLFGDSSRETWRGLEVVDEAAPRHPVFLMSKDFHSAWLNTPALQRLLALERLPEKCVLGRRGDGAPSGLVYEDIFALKEQLVPPLGRQESAAALGRLVHQLTSYGITTVHNNEPPEAFERVRDTFAGSAARVRTLWNFVFDSPEALRAAGDLYRMVPSPWLAAGGAKLFLDGSFGSLTAALHTPYDDTANERGILNLDADELDAWLSAISDVGTYGVFHAIGDRASDVALAAIRRRHWPEGTRHRIEHAQLLSRELCGEDLSNIVFSLQPSHMWGDREIVARHLGHAKDSAYLCRTMQARGGLLVFGSDAPIEDADPWKGITAAVTRLAGDGASAWNASEAIDLGMAIAAHTSHPALLHDRFFHCGALAVGKKADLVVFDRDPFAVEATMLWGAEGAAIRADMTFLDGRLVFSR